MNNGYSNGNNAAAAAAAATQAQNLSMQWNPKHLEIKTRSVERTLEPLVMQVTTLVASKSPQKKKGKSKRAHVLVAAVERATANFVEKGRLIAQENPEIEPEMVSAVEEVQSTGELMSGAAREFATDPCSSAKRGTMVSSEVICVTKPSKQNMTLAIQVCTYHPICHSILQSLFAKILSFTSYFPTSYAMQT